METFKPAKELLRENETLRARLEAAEETLQAIRNGEIDAVIASGPRGDQVYTLEGADHVYRMMVEQMSESAVTLSLDGTILFTNANLSALLDSPAEQVLGKPLRDFVSPANQALFDRLLRQAAQGKASGEVLLQGSSRKEVPAYLSLSALHLEKKTLVSVLLTDLSERKKTEALLSKGQLSSAILEQAAEAIIVCDPAGVVIRASSHARRLCGNDAPLGGKFEDCFPLEVIDRSSKQVGQGSEKSDTARSPRFRLAEMKGNDSPRGLDVCLRRDDGHVFYLILSGRPVENEIAERLGWVLTLTDITERKRMENALRESEAKFRLASMAANEGLWEINFSTGKVWWSDNYDRLFGARPKDTEESWDWWAERIHPDDREGVVASLKKTVASEEARWEAEYRFASSEKPETYLHIYDRALLSRDVDGKPSRIIGAMLDITERKRMEEDLRRAKEAADLANKAKSVFLANMSHEIRTPMNGVLGMTELALLDNITPQTREYLQYAKQSGKALLDIINDILDLSKIESGKVGLVKRPFRLRESLESMLQLLSVSARKKGLGFYHAVDIDVPDCLMGDQGRLRQVLTNLIGNAVKYTEHGAIRVAVGFDGQAHCLDSARLLFRVKDSGLGISKDRLEEAFEAFSQIGLSSHAQFGGTGLGLSIAKNLVEMMGGRIWAESEPGKGSTFSFTAAFGRAEDTDMAKKAPFTQAQGGVFPLRILLAEDNRISSLYASHVLQDWGHRVEVAVDGQQAIEKLGAGKFDLVLMDVRMPVMDGEQATKIIRSGQAGDPGIPIVALTAYALRGDRDGSWPPEWTITSPSRSIWRN